MFVSRKNYFVKSLAKYRGLKKKLLTTSRKITIQKLSIKKHIVIVAVSQNKLK